LSLPVYQKIKTTSHTFQKGQWYSLRSLAQILGFSATGIRQRCIVDSWPTLPVYFSAGRIRRPQFVDGAFLADIQQAIRGGEQ
jgi:hypothetical protein